MGFTTVFKNFGHAIASTAKYIAIGVKDVVLVANKSQAVAPQVDLLVGALAGPLGVKAADLAFHVLGDVATALEKTGSDANTVAASNGLNIKLDASVINDIRTLVPVLEKIIRSVGGQVPSVQ